MPMWCCTFNKINSNNQQASQSATQWATPKVRFVADPKACMAFRKGDHIIVTQQWEDRQSLLPAMKLRISTYFTQQHRCRSPSFHIYNYVRQIQYSAFPVPMKQTKRTKRPNSSEQPYCSDNAWAECSFQVHERWEPVCFGSWQVAKCARSSGKKPSDCSLIISSTSEMQTAQVAPPPSVVCSPWLDLQRVRWALCLIRTINIRTVAEQEFHSCGVSQGSCSAERAIPNLESKFT